MLRWRWDGTVGRRVALLLGLVLAAAPAVAQGVLLTLLDGDAVLTDGARRLAATPGVSIAPGTIIETGPKTALLRLEWPDQSVVDLGPATRAMILPPGFRPRSGRPPALYLLQGWAKVAGSSAAPVGGVLAARFEILPFSGAAVVFADPRESRVFAESGPVEVLDRSNAGAPGAQHGVAAGALWSGGGSAGRPPAGWLQKVPRAFRDPIPKRAAQFKDRSIDASVLAPPTYVDLADWLVAEPELRREFPHRFGTLLQEPAFRRAVTSRIALHPEWVPVLNRPQR